MINTKLIFVDGVPGSGKSTTAQFIARQLEKNGIKVKMYNETDDGHPLDHDYDIVDPNEYWTEHLKRFPEQWKEFSNMVENCDCVYVLESCIYQNILWFLFYYDFDRQIIKDFSHQLCRTVIKLNPVIIYFHQQDIESMMKKNCQRRGNAWKQWFTKFPEKSLYCQNRNLFGETGAIKYLDDFQNMAMELFQESNFKKIQIENTAQDWENYRKQIFDILELPMIEEKLFDESYVKYCGNYSGVKIYINDNRLCMDGFWTNITLIPLKDDEFQMEGYPIVIKFIADESSIICSLKIIKSTTIYKEGLELLKKTPLELDQNELEKFCGEFYCESEKLTRKIFLKDESLFLWRGENNETKLLVLSQTKLIIQITCSLLNFKFTEKDKQFIFSAYGQEDLLFLQTQTI